MKDSAVKRNTESRPVELTTQFYKVLEGHLAEVRAGKALKLFGIRDLAERLFVHPVHLSNTIKEVTGKSPCDIYEEQIIDIAKNLLRDSSLTIADVAEQLTFDPSNFTKFFKKWEGITPKNYRNQLGK